MSTVSLSPDALTIELSAAEKVACLHGDVSVPLSDVTAVDLLEDGLAAAQGLRAPGLGMPGVRKLGTWRTGHGSEFVDVRRGEPALRLHLQDQTHASVLVSSPDAAQLAAHIREHLEESR